jgi:hypothetical protein
MEYDLIADNFYRCGFSNSVFVVYNASADTYNLSNIAFRYNVSVDDFVKHANAYGLVYKDYRCRDAQTNGMYASKDTLFTFIDWISSSQVKVTDGWKYLCIVSLCSERKFKTSLLYIDSLMDLLEDSIMDL